MPAIILAIHFEAELGNFFEQAYNRLNRSGPFHVRSGFRMLETQDKFWDFDMAWWNAAIDDTEHSIKRSYCY